MGEIINLNKVRKARAKAEAKRTAEVNRAEHGVAKGEKSLAKSKRKNADKTLDGKARDEDG